MFTLIENYRGYDILFDSEKETFISHIDDGKKEKKSFASSKKLIDDYLKDNANFKPFKIHHEYNPKQTVTVVGIRKDGRFSTENNKGEKGQVADYDERHWILPNPENDKHYTRISELRSQIEELKSLIVEETNKIIKEDLRGVKTYLLPA